VAALHAFPSPLEEVHSCVLVRPQALNPEAELHVTVFHTARNISKVDGPDRCERHQLSSPWLCPWGTMPEKSLENNK